MTKSPSRMLPLVDQSRRGRKDVRVALADEVFRDRDGLVGGDGSMGSPAAT